MSKSKVTGSPVKIFDTSDDRLKNNANDVIKNACSSAIEDLDDEAIKKTIKRLKELLATQETQQ